MEIVKQFSKAENGEWEEPNEVEPSESITQCIGEFLGCLQDKREGEKLSAQANQCYKLFQDCSGSVILIPDV